MKRKGDGAGYDYGCNNSAVELHLYTTLYAFRFNYCVHALLVGEASDWFSTMD